MPVGDIFEWQLLGIMEGQRTRNIFHYRTVAEAGTGATLQAMGGALYTNIGTLLRLFMSSNYFTEGFRITRIRPTLGVPYEDSDESDAGAVAGDSLPTFVAAIITIHTALGGRKRRGRKYIGGVPEANADQSGLTAAALVVLQNAADEFNDAITVGTLGNETQIEPVLYSRSDNTFNLITGATARSKLGTMRSRKIGRGE